MLSDTIAAVSTARGTGGIAVIRISGGEAIAVAERVFVPKSGKGITEYPPKFAIYGDIKDSTSEIDSGVLTYYVAPHSYTGEDLVEISCHGGHTVTMMVLAAVLEGGARMAEGGEFTRRAFINDKIGLTEAEAVGNMLNAESERGVRLSSRHINGSLTKELDTITNNLISLVSSLFACIDYPEEDLEDMSDSELTERIGQSFNACKALADTYRSGHAVAHGINTVIVGKPNAGKSSFFNRLVSSNRAIVTDIPGTTRDMLDENVEIDGVLLRVWDTAGMRNTTGDMIEAMGIDMAREKITADDTELIFALFDLSSPLDSSDTDLIERLREVKDAKTVVPVYTKCDINSEASITQVESVFGKGYRISSKTGDGITELKRAVVDKFLTDAASVDSGTAITNVRQLTELKKCMECLEKAQCLVRDGMKDMALAELENAINAVGEIDSRTASEKIVNEIFSKFCVGK